MKIILVLFIIIVIKAILNLIRFLQCKYYLNCYFDWIKTMSWNLTESRQKVISLMNEAGVSDGFVSHVQPAGYGLLTTANVSVFNNFPNNREDMFQIMVTKFHEAIGVYKSRIIDTISPVYWIQLIIYLPKNIFMYLGVEKNSIIIKIFQIIWWAFGIIFMILLRVYQIEIANSIKPFINSIK